MSILTIRNGGWYQKGFDYDFQNRTLTINSPELKYLKSKPAAGAHLCALRFLLIHKLTLKNTNFEIKELIGSKINTLDVREANLNSFAQIGHIQQLEEIIISKNQFPKEILQKLPPRIRVIEK